MNDHKVDTVIEGGGFWSLLLVLAALAFLVCCWLGGLAYATEAPGCGNQHYRPRLAQCCPKYLAGETLPPKCTHALADGFLDACCGAEPTPTATPSCGLKPWLCPPSPTPTCPPGWTCRPSATPTPTYWPDKSSCCANVLFLYRNARHAIIEEKQGELKELIQWKQEAMRQCREEYQR